jgi:hypothetical protein
MPGRERAGDGAARDDAGEGARVRRRAGTGVGRIEDRVFLRMIEDRLDCGLWPLLLGCFYIAGLLLYC